MNACRSTRLPKARRRDELRARRREERAFEAYVAEMYGPDVLRRLAAGEEWEQIEQAIDLSKHILKIAAARRFFADGFCFQEQGDVPLADGR